MAGVLWDKYGFGEAFTSEWRRQWGSEFAELLDSETGTVNHLWGDFSLSANLRGREIALDIAALLSKGVPSFVGRRALDIGCGMGGTTVAMAELGAVTSGIDLDGEHVLLAAANARDHGVDVSSVSVDLLDSQARRDLGTFDAIAAEDVLEHVSDAGAAVFAISEMLAEGGVARVTIPNGDAVPHVIADGHYLLPGLTLLRDRDDAAAYFGARFDWGSYDVGDYHNYGDYERWFREAGLTIRKVALVDSMDIDALATELEKARVAVMEASVDTGLPERVRRGLDTGWQDYTSRVQKIRDQGSTSVAIRLGARAWRFYLTRGELNRRWAWRKPPRWAWRVGVKRVPGVVRLVRTLRG